MMTLLPSALIYVACIHQATSLGVVTRKDIRLRYVSSFSSNTRCRIWRPNCGIIRTTSRFAANDENDSKENDDLNTENVKEDVKVFERAEVLGYRSALIATSLGFGVASAASMLSSGTGLAPETVEALQKYSSIAIGWGSCFTALLAPPYRDAATDSKNDDSLNAFLLVLNEALPTLGAFAIVVELVNAIQWNISTEHIPLTLFSLAPSENLEKAAGLFMAAISLREILFYGVAFKVEAVFAIAFILIQPLNLGISPHLSSTGLALSLLVLSFGKVFEPVRSDLNPDQSAFFLNGQQR